MLNQLHNHAFWQGRRVLITGHTGFKGGWLSLWLQHLGADVLGYSLAPSTTPNLFTLAKIAEGMTHMVGDIRDLSHLQTVTQTFEPEIIIHMAAQALVRESYTDPVATYDINVMGTVKVLEAARSLSNLKAILVITSDKCYDNKEWAWGYRENDTLGGRDPYSNSKGCAELVVDAYRQSFLGHQVAVASARAGNVIGGGDWAADRLVPDIMKSALNQQTLMIRYPQAIRPWQHVLDPLAGYLLLLEKLCQQPEAFVGAWNFGPGERNEQTVEFILNSMGDHLPEPIKWQCDDDNFPHEAGYLKLDCSKANQQLQWHSKLPLDLALKFTVEWYLNYHNGQVDMQAFSLKQIAEFENISYGIPQ